MPVKADFLGEDVAVDFCRGPTLVRLAKPLYRDLTALSAHVAAWAFVRQGLMNQVPLAPETLLPQSAEHALRSIPLEASGHALVVGSVELAFDSIGLKEGPTSVAECSS